MTAPDQVANAKLRPLARGGRSHMICALTSTQRSEPRTVCRNRLRLRNQNQDNLEDMLVFEPYRILNPFHIDMGRSMIFVDGENLAIRYNAMLKAKCQSKMPDVEFQENIFVWRRILSEYGPLTRMRQYYYTAVQGDHHAISDVERELKRIGIETPRVFKKEKGKQSKRVDITLATDMLLHATRKHYDLAVLVAGDEDYVPLVEAVQGEGARVAVWFVSDGLSEALRLAADDFADLDQFLFEAPPLSS